MLYPKDRVLRIDLNKRAFRFEVMNENWAVMGSKNLKAIALTRIPKGTCQVARPETLDGLVKEAYRVLVKHPLGKKMRDLGSSNQCPCLLNYQAAHCELARWASFLV